jgi:hypothetical protein
MGVMIDELFPFDAAIQPLPRAEQLAQPVESALPGITKAMERVFVRRRRGTSTRFSPLAAGLASAHTDSLDTVRRGAHVCRDGTPARGGCRPW